VVSLPCVSCSMLVFTYFFTLLYHMHVCEFLINIKIKYFNIKHIAQYLQLLINYFSLQLPNTLIDFSTPRLVWLQFCDHRPQSLLFLAYSFNDPSTLLLSFASSWAISKRLDLACKYPPTNSCSNACNHLLYDWTDTNWHTLIWSYPWRWILKKFHSTSVAFVRRCGHSRQLPPRSTTPLDAAACPPPSPLYRY